MRAGHGKDVRGAIDQRGGKRLAAETADVHTFLLTDLDRIETRRLPAHCVHASRGNFDVSPISEQTAKKPFRNRAAANVTCADKEDVFHDSGGASERDSNLESNLPKSILPNVGAALCRDDFLDAAGCRAAGSTGAKFYPRGS